MTSLVTITSVNVVVGSLDINNLHDTKMITHIFDNELTAWVYVHNARNIEQPKDCRVTVFDPVTREWGISVLNRCVANFSHYVDHRRKV